MGAAAVILEFPTSGGVMGPQNQSEAEYKKARAEAKSLVKEAMQELLNERDALDHERHHADHDFVQLLREERKRRHDRWESVKTSVLGAMILGCIGGVGSFLYWVGNLWLSTRGHDLGPPPSP